MSQSTRTSSALLSGEMMAKLERMELVTRKVFRGRMKGERRSKRRGQSVEFADFRNYVAGDDLRFIDWNLFARLDRLYLKIFLEEEDLHLYTIVDDSQSMSFGDPSKFWVAKQIAASLSYVGLCHGDRVSLSTFSTCRSPLIIRGKSSVHRMLGLLETSKCQSRAPTSKLPLGEIHSSQANAYENAEVGKSVDSRLRSSTRALSSNISMRQAVKEFCLTNQGKGIVILITDLLDPEGYEAALRMLIAREMDVFLVHILSPEELSPSMEGDLKLTDCEAGTTIDISMTAPMLQLYHETLQKFLADAKHFCSKLSINYVPARSDQNVEILVSEYLRSRGLVR